MINNRPIYSFNQLRLGSVGETALTTGLKHSIVLNATGLKGFEGVSTALSSM